MTQRENWSTDHVIHWQTLYRDTYDQSPTHADPTFNISGWTSSYTGQLLSDVGNAGLGGPNCGSHSSLQPNSVLEIGCGTGLLLARIAPTCDRYDATDFSPEALSHIERLKTAQGDLDHVSLWERTAADLNGLPLACYDTVVINSVIQYFPSLGYLLKVLQEAVPHLNPSGCLFIGDVRSLPLLEVYHASVQRAQGGNDLSLDQLQRQIQRQLMEEEELVIDPEFFLTLSHYLPQISAVQIQLKRSRHQNELTRFRYDVVLQVDKARPPSPAIPWIDWTTTPRHPDQVRQQLMSPDSPESLGVRGIPNPRLQGDLALLDHLATAPAQASIPHPLPAAPTQPPGIDPNEWWECTEDLPYRAIVTWSATDRGCYDVLLTATADRVPTLVTPESNPIHYQNQHGMPTPTTRCRAS